MIITTTPEHREQTYRMVQPIISAGEISPKTRAFARAVATQETAGDMIAAYKRTRGFRGVYRQSMRESLNPALNPVQLVRQLLRSVYSDLALTWVQGQLDPNATVLPPVPTSAVYQNLHPDGNPVSFPYALIIQHGENGNRIAGLCTVLGMGTDLASVQGRLRLDRSGHPDLFDEHTRLLFVGFQKPEDGNRRNFGEWRFLPLPLSYPDFKTLVFNDIYLRYKPKGLEQDMPTLAEIQQTIILGGDRHPKQGLTFGI
ncbi:hypothetical protein HYS92_02195 [Candidatus Daviesbacteria bacterium]|nr:hypothetical protein [Candidatus Daviesbacteria bacterium]